ncbi:Cilia- and flagella-associated protein 221 [Rhizophlyctis rosea]|uniref:Cilia- and flagella-associated protein 221 n=1 Tax=Rhizophlyctis rosea TaxID=64517 RepID=A0AAD5SIB3_9FUNG|nr:Cilia- and flagella-associated protein 221 [Rhizophlyctis rosea]
MASVNIALPPASEPPPPNDSDSEIYIPTLSRLPHQPNTQTVPLYMMPPPLQPPATPLFIKPSVVHFQFTHLLEPIHKTIRVLNADSKAMRLMFKGPTKGPFSMTFRTKGSIVPGGSAEIFVEFLPGEWRYYYECLEVASSAGVRVMIPLHAYPKMDGRIFPPKISFGKCAMYETQTKIIPIRSLVPNAFDFEIEVEAHPRNAFAVTPLRGVVRGGAPANIQIDFTPVSRQPALMKLTINTSQFGSKPCTCVVTGVGIAPEPTLTFTPEPVEDALDVEQKAVEKHKVVPKRPHRRKASNAGLLKADGRKSPGPKGGMDSFMQELKARVRNSLLARHHTLVNITNHRDQKNGKRSYDVLYA